MPFFERFRAELRRYADGVHELGAPASAAELARAEARLGRSLPPGLADFYHSWNGVRLFADAIVVLPVSELIDAGDALALGEALGAPLLVDDAGHVLELDDAGDRLRVGSTLERWLAAVTTREGLLVDREGEWRDVFDGGELSGDARRKRARAGIKADPDAAAWWLEQAELAFEAGEADEAAAALERAVAADAGAGGAWALLGALQLRARRLDEAERSFVRAAEASRQPQRRAERLAEAARAAAEAGRAEARATHAAGALAADRSLLERWLADARARLEEGDADGALQRAALADALAPGGEAAALLHKARARRSLPLA